MCQGETLVSETPAEINSYRAKLHGIHATLMAIKAICDFHAITEGSIKIFCNCDNAIVQAKSQWKQLPLGTKHADLIWVIRWMTAELPIKVCFQEIKGHQDQHADYLVLTRPSQMNVDCDSAAKAYLRELAYSNLTMAVPSTIHQEGWTCWIDGIKTTMDHLEPVCMAVSSKVIKKHLDYKSCLNKEAFDRVDWDTVRCTMKNFPPLFQMWVTKHVSSHCGVGRQMKLHGKWDSNKCPCCEEVEWAPHVCSMPRSRPRRGMDGGDCRPSRMVCCHQDKPGNYGLYMQHLDSMLHRGQVHGICRRTDC